MDWLSHESFILDKINVLGFDLINIGLRSFWFSSFGYSSVRFSVLGQL